MQLRAAKYCLFSLILGLAAAPITQAQVYRAGLVGSVNANARPGPIGAASIRAGNGWRGSQIIPPTFANIRIEPVYVAQVYQRERSAIVFTSLGSVHQEAIRARVPQIRSDATGYRIGARTGIPSDSSYYGRGYYRTRPYSHW